MVDALCLHRSFSQSGLEGDSIMPKVFTGFQQRLLRRKIQVNLSALTPERVDEATVARSLGPRVRRSG